MKKKILEEMEANEMFCDSVYGHIHDLFDIGVFSGDTIVAMTLEGVLTECGPTPWSEADIKEFIERSISEDEG